MLPFQQPFLLAVSMFAIPSGLDIVDTGYETINFVDNQVKLCERNIEAAVDKSGGRRMDHSFGGSVSDGDLIVTTTETLYIADEYDPDNPNDPQRQSFFTFHGFEYRVSGVDHWSKQLGVNVYLAKRHVVQELMQGSTAAPLQGDF
jgi:hypothetical protein